jgi:RNA polymerase sigma-70 factor, ECF subfamily
VHAILLRLLGNRQDADDVMQETFLRAFRKLSSYRGTASFATWLVRIAINLGKNQYVRRKGRETIPLDECAAEELSELRDPAHDLTRAEEQKRVHDALAALSANHRQVLVLRDLQEFSYKEISRMLNCPIGTVMSRLSHARRALAQQLGESPAAAEEGPTA